MEIAVVAAVMGMGSAIVVDQTIEPGRDTTRNIVISKEERERRKMIPREIWIGAFLGRGRMIENKAFSL
jgi:hypothetical protein